MTAEVAIINSNAVALAADSAVTVGGGKKIYNSAIKLFTLSKTEPVGVMIYGNADLISAPWETLIKLFRKHIHNKCFNNLKTYGDSFFKFLNANSKFFPEKEQDRWIENQSVMWYQDILKETEKTFEEEKIHGNHFDDDERSKLLELNINKFHEFLSSRPITLDINNSEAKIINKKAKNAVKEAINYLFRDFTLSKKSLNNLYDIAFFCVYRHTFLRNSSGIVIAGFGDDEIYPSVITYEVAGVYDNKLIYRTIDGKTIISNGESDAGIIAFAQEDMVATLMQGVNPNLLEYMNSHINQSMTDIKNFIEENFYTDSTEQYIPIDKKTLGDNFQQLIDASIKNLQNQIKEDHIAPVVNMVASLPKDELAAMAESLVNLTAFKRRITESLETVGGPIDVAVISKGDGFIWVKRKHYFPAELNQHFFTNYFRCKEHEEDK
ncbi:hypothetical protein [Acinetobacter faecalis]|uniref:hypothetical protein n=1 Tax=Acinetobacter faecalis TaxID=2665161 RepID=UPI002A90CEA9|nr:hypothetical protein [Acinetobacter faecalis]MDY6450684.1 hypothetical protein [Acinetobacter faecalis]